jgi:hypothetical protein
MASAVGNCSWQLLSNVAAVLGSWQAIWHLLLTVAKTILCLVLVVANQFDNCSWQLASNLTTAPGNCQSI